MKALLFVVPVAVLTVFMIIFSSGCQSQNANENKSYFRTKFNNKKIEDCVHNFVYWNEIQSKEVDLAFEAYFTGSYLGDEKETALILELINRGGFLGAVAEAHEKWEVLEYLKKGYSLEEIGNGKAYKEYKPIAHTEARFKELRFCQFWYKQLFNEDPPAMKAFLFVDPLLQIVVWDIYKIEVDEKIMKMLVVDELEKYKDVVDSENCSRKDVENCIKFFEATGYNYGDQKDLFLKRGLDFLNKFGQKN